MARKSKPVTIEAPGRDHGKRFIITEMPAAQAEAWAFRAMGAMARAGLDIPTGTMESGMAGFAMVGLKAFLAAPWEVVAPLLAEAMACVRVIMPAFPDGRALVEDGNGDDIEEVATRIKLRDEVFELHLGFSIATALLMAVAGSMGEDEAPPSPDTETSTGELAQ